MTFLLRLEVIDDNLTLLVPRYQNDSLLEFNPPAQLHGLDTEISHGWNIVGRHVSHLWSHHIISGHGGTIVQGFLHRLG